MDNLFEYIPEEPILEEEYNKFAYWQRSIQQQEIELEQVLYNLLFKND